MKTSRTQFGAVPLIAIFLACASALSGFALADGLPTHGSKITIPATTTFTVKLDEAVSAKTAERGGGFTVTFSEPVLINGVIVIPAGASGAGLVSEEAQHSTQMELNSVFVNGRSYRVTTSAIILNPKTSFPPGKKVTFDLTFSLSVVK
jgi:hypothetical protein